MCEPFEMDRSRFVGSKPGQVGWGIKYLYIGSGLCIFDGAKKVEDDAKLDNILWQIMRFVGKSS